MPVHDWSRVDANLFHHFHQRSTIAICDRPAYLGEIGYVPVPLEMTYQAAWATYPSDLRELVETGKLSGEDGRDA